jgi:hypothetical protein
MASGAHNYYETLGVRPAASTAEIRRAYRRLARQHHPDLNPGDKLAEERFKSVQEAYRVLIDSNARRMYDRTAVNPESGSAGTPATATGAASTHPATDPGAFEHRERMHARAAADAGRRYVYVPPPSNTASRTSDAWLGFLLVCGIAGWSLGAASLRYHSPLVDRFGLAGARVFAPVPILFVLGLLFGGGRGNFLVRCVLINAAVWSLLVLYCWSERIEWPLIVRLLAMGVLPTHTPIIGGAFFRRGFSC